MSRPAAWPDRYAALFLKRFAKQAKCYTHLDIYGWVLKPRPGRTEGGEPQVARALFETLAEKYGS